MIGKARGHYQITSQLGKGNVFSHATSFAVDVTAFEEKENNHEKANINDPAVAGVRPSRQTVRFSRLALAA